MVAFCKWRADSAFWVDLSSYPTRIKRYLELLFQKEMDNSRHTLSVLLFIISVYIQAETNERSLKCARRALSVISGAGKKLFGNFSWRVWEFLVIPFLPRGYLPSAHKWATLPWDIPEHSCIPTGCDSWLLSELSLASDNIGGRDKAAPWRTER